MSQRGSAAFMEEGGAQCERAKARGHLLVKEGGECHMEEAGGGDRSPDVKERVAPLVAL